MKLAGNTALVTGAGRGIGQAIARLLVQHGARVAVNDVNRASAEATSRELIADGHAPIAVPYDVNDPDAVDQGVRQTFEQFGRIDILVNNAAAQTEIAPFVTTTVKDQADELATLMGVLHCTRSVLAKMIENRNGRIVNITSIAGGHGQPRRAVYSGAKAGIEGFSRSLSAEVGQHGITVNCVSPGPTNSPRFKARSPELRKAALRMGSLARIVEPEEVAQAVLFLASDMANAITGAVIDVDAGFTGFMPPQSETSEQ